MASLALEIDRLTDAWSDRSKTIFMLYARDIRIDEERLTNGTVPRTP